MFNFGNKDIFEVIDRRTRTSGPGMSSNTVYRRWRTSGRYICENDFSSDRPLVGPALKGGNSMSREARFDKPFKQKGLNPRHSSLSATASFTCVRETADGDWANEFSTLVQSCAANGFWDLAVNGKALTRLNCFILGNTENMWHITPQRSPSLAFSVAQITESADMWWLQSLSGVSRVLKRRAGWGVRRRTMSRYRNSAPTSRHSLQTRVIAVFVRMSRHQIELGPRPIPGSEKKGVEVAKANIVRKISGGGCLKDL